MFGLRELPSKIGNSRNFFNFLFLNWSSVFRENDKEKFRKKVGTINL